MLNDLVDGAGGEQAEFEGEVAYALKQEEDEDEMYQK